MEPQRAKPSDELQTYSDILDFGERARDAAVRLFAISQVPTLCHDTRKYQCDIASKLFALYGVMSEISNIYRQTWGITIHAWFSERLRSNMAACDFVLVKIQATVAEKAAALADPMQPTSEAAPDTVVLTPEEASELESVLQSLFTDFALKVARTGNLVRSAEFTNKTTKGNCPSDELRHSQGIAPLGTNTSSSRDTSVSGHAHTPLPQSYHPLQPQPQPQNNSVDWAYGHSPRHRSTSEDSEDYEHIPSNMADKLDKNNGVIPSVETDHDHPVNTPASTRENTPAARPAHGLFAPTIPGSKNAAAEVITSKSTQPTSLFGTGPASLLKGGGQAWQYIPPLPSADALRPKQADAQRSEPLYHLEAYILQPHVSSYQYTTTWSTNIELLQLDEAAMQAHLDKRAAATSIIDAMGQLHREQLRLVQAHTTSRAGRLVSVQQGTPSDMVTQMGTFQITPVIFVITTAALPAGPFTAVPISTTAARPSLFGGFGTNNYPQPHISGPPAYANPFQNNGPTQAAPSSGLFGVRDGPDLFGNHASGIHQPLPPSAHKCERNCCFLAEKDGYSTFASQHYQTITMSAPYQSRSLEELRVSDYAIGCVGPSKGHIFSPEPVMPPPFGGQYVRPPLGAGSGSGSGAALPAASSVSGSIEVGPRAPIDSKPASGGSLFGQPAPYHQRPQPSGGLFGAQSSTSGSGPFSKTEPVFNPDRGLFGQNVGPLAGYLRTSTSSTGGGLFGNVTSAPSAGLFGTAPAAPSTSLFGNAAPEKTPTQPGQPAPTTSTEMPNGKEKDLTPVRHRQGLFIPNEDGSNGTRKAEQEKPTPFPFRVPTLFANINHPPVVGSQPLPLPHSGSLFASSTSPSRPISPKPTVPARSTNAPIPERVDLFQGLGHSSAVETPVPDMPKRFSQPFGFSSTRGEDEVVGEEEGEKKDGE